MQQVTRDDIVVSVLMPTYNQAAYIEQAVRSVCAQQAPFRYEVLVSDDASTDGTADCLRALEREITPPHLQVLYQTENQFSQGVDPIRDILLPRARGRYICICEGDDYWSTTDKIAKQAAIMDAEEDVGLVYTYYHHLDQRTGTLTPASCDELEGYVYPRVLAGKTTIRYVTVMMRRDLMLSAPYLGKRIVYDTFWFYQCSRLHRVRLLREYTAVYRHLDTSASHYKRDDRMARINYFYVINSARRYFCEHYPCEDDTLRRRQLKKATVHCFKYALAHRDGAICLDLHIPFIPLYSLKKTLYCILHKCCKSPRIFNALCDIYARHISK